MLLAPVTFSHVAATCEMCIRDSNSPATFFYLAQSATIVAVVPPVYESQFATATQLFPEKYVHEPEVGIAF